MLQPVEPELEEVEDAIVDGDVPYTRGTAQAALRHKNFRIVYFGTFASNIGTWMQNVVLGAYALKLTGSPTLVDVVYRRRLLVGAQFAQMMLSFVLAALALSDQPSRVALVVLVFAIGIAN